MTEINKYSRNYENLNQIELKILLKHYDDSYTPQKYKNKEEMIAALVSYVPNFNSINNTDLYYFTFDPTSNLTTWYANSSAIDISSFPLKLNTHRNKFCDSSNSNSERSITPIASLFNNT